MNDFYRKKHIQCVLQSYNKNLFYLAKFAVLINLCIQNMILIRISSRYNSIFLSL